jgi:hypothetical protein
MDDTKIFQLKFFLPDARILTEDEIANLPPEKRQAVEEIGKTGLWLEIACPDISCVDKHGTITVPAKGFQPQQEEGFFLNVFCPEHSCEIEQGTDLP